MSLRRLAAALAATLTQLPAHAASLNRNHTLVWSFTGQADGSNPRGDLLVDAMFNIYGTTATGGTAGQGNVYEIVPSANTGNAGHLTPIYTFTGGADGSLPSAGLIQDSTGALYGTASMDGAANGGTLFQLVPLNDGSGTWTENTLWSFGAPGDGANPAGNLVLDANGAIYGTTNFGGAYGFGTVFQLTPLNDGSGSWTETILWSFAGGTDGASPVAGLIFDSTGALYGTTAAGGAGGMGTVFQLTPLNDGSGAWAENILWSFSGGTDGGGPTGGLLPDGAGGFYGTTQFGGPVNPTCDQARFPYYGEPDSDSQPAEAAAYVPAGGNACGVVFDLAPNGGTFPWTETILWSFAGGLDGANPVASLTADASGTLYGFTTEYGQAERGTEISLTPPSVAGDPWSLKTITSFDGAKQGFYPRSSPVFGLGGRLYGTTAVGGPSWTHVNNYGFGEVFTSVP